MLQLFDVNKKKIKGLSAYKDYCIESKLKTGDKTLSFLYPKHLSKELKEEGYIRNKTDEFVIKEISNSGNYKSIKAVLNVEDLEGKEWEHFNTTNQTINQCISLALAGTGWTLRMIENISKKRTIKKTNCNSWDIIQEARKTYNAEIEFDTISKIVKVAERLGSDKGAYFIDSLNLKDLKSQSNSYDFYTRIVALGKDDLKVIVENFKYSNKIKTLIWKDEKYTDEASLREDAIIKLDEISKPYHAYDADILDLANMSDKYKDILSYKLGDVITLISKDEYIREKQRIVSMKVWPDKPEKNSCEIANTILSFEDLQKEHQNTADTVNNITSDNGTISEGAIQGVVKKLVVDKADINSLNAVEIRVGDIEATKANITELKVTNANVDKLTANKADVIQLNAVSEKVNLLEADSANIKTLVAGNITADNIQSDLLQSLKGWMLEGSIGNAQISDLDANKIKSGTVDTSLVTVAGPQGRLKLQGNKLQVLDSKDNALYERIMLGVDENNNSALILRGTDGKTILLNQDGLTKAGFTDGYNKIDNNSLDGSKLDINSVVRKVNGATEKISSTVVQAGDKSLNVLLQEQNNNITEHGKNLATQEARITANEKAINLKVDSQTYATDKTTINKNIETTLTNSKAYADDKKSEAISTAATDATTKANAAKDSAVSTAASDATTKANNAKDTAISEAQKKADKALSDSKAYVNQEITTVNSNLSKATSEISVLKGQIALKVEQGDIDKTVTTQINNLEIGGTNLILNTSTPATKENVGWVSSKWILSDKLVSGDYMISFKYTVFELDEVGISLGDSNGVYDGTHELLARLQPGTDVKYSHKIHFDRTNQTNLVIYTNKTITIKEVKVEKGNVVTDWSPNPDDAVNNLSIGGINLLLNTGFRDYTTKDNIGWDNTLNGNIVMNKWGSGYNGGVPNPTVGYHAHFDKIKFNTTVMAFIDDDCRWKGFSSYFPKPDVIIPDKDYIISLDMYAETKDVIVYGGFYHYIKDSDSMGFHSGMYEIKAVEANKWIRYNSVLHTSSDIDTSRPICFYIYGYGSVRGKRYVKNLKLEYGNKPTAWSPAPEDVDQSIADVITTTETKINTAKSEIKAETDKIKLSVSGLDSKTKAIETQLGDKATKSEVKTVSDKAASIEANLGGITQRVSSVESTTSKINDKVANQEQRIQTAEQKITNESIISTVKKAQTDGKATFATTSTVEQLNDRVRFDFRQTGGQNLIKNGAFKLPNYDSDGLWMYYTENGVTSHNVLGDSHEWIPIGKRAMYIGSEGAMSNSKSGVMSCLISVLPNKEYTLDFLCGKSGNCTPKLWIFTYDSDKNRDWSDKDLGEIVCYYPTKNSGWRRDSRTFTTSSKTAYIRVFFYLSYAASNWCYLITTDISLHEGSQMLPYSPHPDEIYSGNTKIDANGVEIYNGALTVKNKAGNKVIEADSNGDITFKGKLQPDDYQLKLFGNDCRIDGSASAIRMQYSPTNYLSMDNGGYMRVFNQRSNSGTNYVSLGVNEEGHTILFCGTTMLKLLGGKAPGVQARWGGDGGYCPMVASDFVNNSTIKAKTNISSLNIENAINIIKENNVRNYQLKSDIDNEMQQENVEYDNKSVIYASNAPIKTGLIIEELTPQAKALLVPKDTDCISLYSMVSLLWGVVQEQQKEIEELKSLVNRG